MSYKKAIKWLTSSMMDGLKDAEMLMDYAKCAKMEEHKELANYFHMRAKTRLQMMNDDYEKITACVHAEEQETGKPYKEGKWDCMYDYFMGLKEALEYSIMNFKL